MTQVFISYARDDARVARSVRQLAERLRADGVDAHLDEWDLAPGDRIPEFMERAIYESAIVVFCCCPAFKAKADGPRGGAGVEASHARARDYESSLSATFVPVIMDGSFDDSVPRFLRPRLALDFTSENSFTLEYPKLLRVLRGLPPSQPPVLAPSAGDRSDASEIVAAFQRAFASPSPLAEIRSAVARYPFVLNALAGCIRYFLEVDFGGELDPDVVCVSWGNYEVWELVVFENPNAAIFDADGLLTPEVEAAIRRVQSWSLWNPQDVDRPRTPDFDTLARAYMVEVRIVVGRRDALGPVGARRLVQTNVVSGPRIKLVTYDTILDFIKAQPVHSLYHFQGEWLAEARSARSLRDLC